MVPNLVSCPPPPGIRRPRRGAARGRWCGGGAWAIAALLGALPWVAGCRGCGCASQGPAETASPPGPAAVATPAPAPRPGAGDVGGGPAPGAVGLGERHDQPAALAPARLALCREAVDALRYGASLTRQQVAAASFATGVSGQGSVNARPEFREAVTCLAVAGDTERGCEYLAGGDGEECRRTVAFYRWARHPQDNLAWRCDAYGRRKAAKKGLAPGLFESLCTALRTRDISKCPPPGTEEGDGCRAEISLDPTYCRGRKYCIEEVKRNKTIVSGGLAARVATAKGREKIYLSGALEGLDGCKATFDALRAACALPVSPGPPGPSGSGGQPADRAPGRR